MNHESASTAALPASITRAASKQTYYTIRYLVDRDRTHDAYRAGYLAQIKSLRCRLAGYAYMARFMGVLDAIEKQDYRLRPAYAECKNFSAGLKMSWSVLLDSLRFTSLRRLATP